MSVGDNPIIAKNSFVVAETGGKVLPLQKMPGHIEMRRSKLVSYSA
jgi:hypothetical protein